ncbi:MAG: hypothetical protein IJ106_06385 [Parasporobacterium sp.]|nr:hypothetical protein [Parasporobacterium sp.]
MVKQLSSHIGNFELKKLLVPVVFGKAAEAVIRAADEIQPEIILCIGQAAGRTSITPNMLPSISVM